MTLENFTLEDAVAMLNEAEAKARAAKKEKDAAAKLQKAADEKVDEIRADILAMMKRDGVIQDDTPLAVVTVVGTAGRLVIDDPGSIPGEFVELMPVRQDDKIKARLQSGLEVNGAHIEPGADTVRIKWRTK